MARIRRTFATLGAAFVLLPASLGCASVGDVLSTPTLDRRVPTLRPAADGYLELVSRHVCGAHITVNLWHQESISDDIQIELFDSYACRSVSALVYFGNERFIEGPSITIPRSAEREFPLSVFAGGASQCNIDFPPALGGGKVYMIVEIDEELATTRFHAYTPRQHRALARKLRRREAAGRACRRTAMTPAEATTVVPARE